MYSIWQDLRYAQRAILQKPGFAVVAVLTVALGIGANTAIFSVLNAVVLRPLPYPDPGRLVEISSSWDEYELGSVSLPEYVDYRAQAQSFAEIAAYRMENVNLAHGDGEPVHVWGTRVTHSLFDVLRIPPARGRAFTAEESESGQTVALLSDALWQQNFGGDPQILGRTVRINAETYTVIGVLPPGFHFPNREAQLWLPTPLDPESLANRGNHNRQVVARLKDGVTLQQARAEMHGIAQRLAAQYPNNYPQGSGFDLVVATLEERLVGETRPAMLLLMAAAGLVLLIACANTANLLLVRAGDRYREMAIRTALGAGRGRLLRQLLTESIAIALAGGLLAVMVVWWALDLLVALGPADVPRLEQTRIDAGVLGFAFALTLLTGVIFGLVPAWQAGRVAPLDWLKQGGTVAGDQASGMRRLLTVGQVAVAVVLLVAGGLLIRSFDRVLRVDPGLRPQRVLTARISLPRAKYDVPARASFYSRLMEGLRAQPAVESVGGISILPFSGDNTDYSFGIEGYVAPVPGLDLSEQAREVLPGYFETMGIPLRRGRFFDGSETAEGPYAVIISESLARKFLSDRDPIGARVKLWGLDAEGPWRTIVGVVGDVRHAGLSEEIKPILYLPHTQRSVPSMMVAVRTSGEPQRVAGLIREQVRKLDPEQPIHEIATMEELVSGSVAATRFRTLLVGVFAALALALAAVGIYGVLAHYVAQRTREIGIRCALGAQRRDVLRLVLGQGTYLVLLGMGIGMAGAMWATRFLEGMLFGVTSTDPLTYTAIVAVLLPVALLACWIPARRATRVDPMVALRYE